MEDKIKIINLGNGEDFQRITYFQTPVSIDTITNSRANKDLDKLFLKKFGSKRIN